MQDKWLLYCILGWSVLSCVQTSVAAVLKRATIAEPQLLCASRDMSLCELCSACKRSMSLLCAVVVCGRSLLLREESLLTATHTATAHTQATTTRCERAASD
eukprot:18509-Heterococcus_DN1.PRE.3